MAYKKVIRGDDNISNETASHNKISIETSGSFKIFAVFFCVLITAAIVFTVVLNLELVKALVVGSFIATFVTGWLMALSLVVRHASSTRTAVAIDTAIRNRSLLEQDVIYATDQYILYRDEHGAYQFQGTVQVHENRTILPQLPSPKDPSQGILECWDQGMSARGIEKHMKEAGVTYYQITKVLDSFRKGWNKKTVTGDIVSENEGV